MVVFAVVTALLLSSCSGGDGNDSSSVAPGSTSASSGSATSPTGEAELPPFVTIRDADGQTIKSTSSADWVLVASERAWVSGVGRGVGYYDARTGRLQGSVAVPQGPCASMDEEFGSVWTATCVERGIARIDPKSGAPLPGPRSMFQATGGPASVPARAVFGRSPTARSASSASSSASTPSG